MFALFLAVSHILERYLYIIASDPSQPESFFPSYIIASDSMSMLDMTHRGYVIKFVWVPSHCGIRGNEEGVTA